MIMIGRMPKVKKLNGVTKIMILGDLENLYMVLQLLTKEDSQKSSKHGFELFLFDT